MEVEKHVSSKHAFDYMVVLRNFSMPLSIDIETNNTYILHEIQFDSKLKIILMTKKLMFETLLIKGIR